MWASAFFQLLMLNFKFWICFLCCTVPTEDDSETPLANEDIVSQLVSMGFHLIHCQKAAINTSNAGVEEAMNWLLSHMDDPGIFVFYITKRINLYMQEIMKYICLLDIDAPISKGRGSESIDQSKVDTLISFGFQDDVARKALKASVIFSLYILLFVLGMLGYIVQRCLI